MDTSHGELPFYLVLVGDETGRLPEDALPELARELDIHTGREAIELFDSQAVADLRDARPDPDTRLAEALGQLTDVDHLVKDTAGVTRGDRAALVKALFPDLDVCPDDRLQMVFDVEH